MRLISLDMLMGLCKHFQRFGRNERDKTEEHTRESKNTNIPPKAKYTIAHSDTSLAGRICGGGRDGLAGMTASVLLESEM